ncbi:hypothetical protein [Novipirellula rosea]
MAIERCVVRGLVANASVPVIFAAPISAILSARFRVGAIKKWR